MTTLKRTVRKSNRREFKPQVGVESLGERVMLSGLTATLSASGVLRVVGTDSADDIGIQQKSNKYSVVGVTIVAEPQSYVNGQGQITQLGGPHSSVPAQAVKSIEVDAGAGDDEILLYGVGAGIQPIKLATMLQGRDGDDTIYGGFGVDTIYCGTGDDKVYASDGNDKVFGDTGGDTLIAGKGNDSLYGGDHGDLLFGDDGNDSLMGYDGDDTLFGGMGNDTLWGYQGNDKLSGEIGNDKLFGSEGNDTLGGGAGNDSVCGMDGDDLIKGDSGLDTLLGDAGRDRLEGGPDQDTLGGGADDDLLLAVGGGVDKLQGGTGLDSFWGDAVGGGTTTADNFADDDVFEMSVFRTVHMVDQFVVDFSGGVFPGAASKEPLGQDLSDPIADLPNQTKVDFSDVALFGPDGPQADDIDQGNIGDCYYMAVMSGLAANQPGTIRQSVVDLGDGTYAVRFFRDGAAVYYRVDGELYSTNGVTASYAQVNPVLWPAILEKAWAFHGRQDGRYASIDNGDNPGTISPGDVASAFGRLNSATPRTQFATAAEMADWIQQQFTSSRTLTVTGPGSNADWTLPDGPSNSHQLWISGINASKTQVRIRNPWGGNNAYAWININDMFRRNNGFTSIV